MPEEFSDVSSTSMWEGFMRRHIGPLVIMMLDEESPIPLKATAIHALSHLPLQIFENDRHFIRLFAAAISAVPYTDGICPSVVDVLLQNALSLSDTPVDIWSPWLNKRPSLPPICHGRHVGSRREVVRMVRELGDTKTLTSYLLLVWSEWGSLQRGGFEEMLASIREDFRGITQAHRRKRLLQHLDCVLEELDQGLEHLEQRNPYLDEDAIQRMKLQYGELEEQLQRVHRSAPPRASWIDRFPVNSRRRAQPPNSRQRMQLPNSHRRAQGIT